MIRNIRAAFKSLQLFVISGNPEGFHPHTHDLSHNHRDICHYYHDNDDDDDGDDDDDNDKTLGMPCTHYT